MASNCASGRKNIHNCGRMRKGIGAALIGQVAGYLRQRQMPALYLTTFTHVPWNAPFYARLGFTALEDADMLPTGSLEGSHRADSIKSSGQLMNARAFSDAVVAYRNGAPVRLRDLGEVVDSFKQDKQLTWSNGGAPSIMPADSGGAPVCRRCGTCCLLGGPTLMLSDAALLVSGTLTLEALVCLRAGEWARDDSRKALRPLEGERLKIAGPGGRVHPWRCRYYREGAGCGIYEQRPAQCTALFCMALGHFFFWKQAAAKKPQKG